jgi:hypothetical protein
MTNSMTATLLELLRNLFSDPNEQAEFLKDPDEYLEKHNLDDLSCADFNDALLAFVDTDVDGGDYNLGGRFYADKAEHGGDDHEAVKHVIKKIVEEGDTYHVTHSTTNYDNDTVYDSSFKGTVIADGDVTFDNDITAANGDGAVAAGEDIEGDVVTGDNNFNEGSIVEGDQTASSGGAIANAGDDATAVGSNQDNDQDNDTVVVEDNDTSVDVDTELDNVGNTQVSDDDEIQVEESGPGNVDATN